VIDLLILIFTYLPNIFTHLILGIGIVGIIAAFFISFIPFITMYKVFIKYASIFLIVLGLFLEGGLAVNNDYLERAKEWNNKVQIAETQAKDANAKIEYVYKDKIVKVKEVQVILKDRIIKEAANMDKNCKVNNEAVNILNDAAKVTK